MAFPAAKSGFTLDDLVRQGPDEIARKRKIAEALLAQSGGIHPIANPLEGMAQMAQALIGNLKLARLDRAEREGKSGADALFGAGMGTGQFPAAPGGGASSASSAAVNPNVADGPKGNESYPVASEGGDIAGYIRQAAIARGIDPEVALRVASSEGGLKDPYRQGDAMLGYGREESYGPFQLHMRQGGVGERALKAGIDPRKDWKSGVDYALDEAAQKGWGQWFGAKRVGVGNRAGLDQARAIGTQPAPTQVASLDPAIGMQQQGAAPGQEAIAKALLGPTGYNPATNPANAQVDAMMANGGAGQMPAPIPDRFGSIALAPDAYGAIDPQKVPPINDAQTVVGQPPAAQVPLPTPPQAALPQQQQIGQALVAQNDPQNSMTLGAPPITAQGPDMRTLMGMAGNEFMSPQRQKIIESLIGRKMEQQDPANQLDMQLKQAQLAAAQRPPKAWQKLDDDTLFDPISGETRKVGSGGPTKFEGTGLEAQAWNILQSADPSSREYATAYSIVSQPKIQLVQTENGMMPVEVPPQLPGWLKAPGGGAAVAPPAGQQPDLAAPPPDLAAGIPPVNPNVIPGTKKPPTEIQTRNGAIGKILLNEVPTLGANFKALADPKGQLIAAALGKYGNAWQSEEYQRAANSVKTSISNVLYSLSGASSNPGEVVKQIEVLTPEFGDKPGAIADKLQRFKTYVRSISSEANDPELTKMVEDAIGKMDIPAVPSTGDAEGWKELSPGVKIRPKGQ